MADLNQMAASTLPARLLEAAARWPDAPAVRAKSRGLWRTWSWREAAGEVGRLAAALAAAGVVSGDRAGVLGSGLGPGPGARRSRVWRPRGRARQRPAPDLGHARPPVARCRPGPAAKPGAGRRARGDSRRPPDSPRDRRRPAGGLGACRGQAPAAGRAAGPL